VITRGAHSVADLLRTRNGVWGLSFDRRAVETTWGRRFPPRARHADEPRSSKDHRRVLPCRYSAMKVRVAKGRADTLPRDACVSPIHCGPSRLSITGPSTSDERNARPPSATCLRKRLPTNASQTSSGGSRRPPVTALQSPPGSPESKAAIVRELALDGELNDRVRAITFLGADPRDHDPDD